MSEKKLLPRNVKLGFHHGHESGIIGSCHTHTTKSEGDVTVQRMCSEKGKLDLSHFIRYDDCSVKALISQCVFV